MMYSNSIKTSTVCTKQPGTTNATRLDKKTKLSDNGHEIANSVTSGGQTSRLLRTSNHDNNLEKKSNSSQKSVRRSTRKSPSVPLPPTNPARQKKTSEKRKSDRTRLSIQSHIARLSGGYRDGIVDKTKKSGEESKDHPQQKRGEIQQSRAQNISEQTSVVSALSKIKERHTTPNSRVDKTQHSDDRIKESQKVKSGVRRNPKSGNEKKKETKKPKADGILQSIDTKLGNSIRDKTLPQPDSSRSGTESECCYSTDPDWDTSVWSESSSEDTQPDPYAVRAKDPAVESESEIDMREDTSSNRSNSSRDISFGPEDSYNKTSCMDKSITNTGVRDNLKTRHSFRSNRDGSSVELESSYSSQSCNTDLVSEEKIVTMSHDGLTKSLTREKHSRNRQKYISKLNKNSTEDRQPTETTETGKGTLKRVIDIDKRLSVEQNQKKCTGTRRVQSESVVRGYRYRKQRRSPSLRIDPTTERERKRVKDEKGFVYDKGKGKDSVNKGNETKPTIERGKKNGFANDRGKGKDKLSRLDDAPNIYIQRNHTGTKRRSNETKSFYERDGKSLNTMNKNMTVRNDKSESKVERKSSVRFTLPNRELYKVYSQESAISSDEAMICDGYSDSSSASSIMSEIISDTGGYDSEINGLEGSSSTTRPGNDTRDYIGDEKKLRSTRKSGKEGGKRVKKSNGESESHQKGQQNRKQDKKVTDQPKISDMIQRKKSLIIKDGSLKEIPKKPSLNIVKCQSAKQTTGVADRVPSKLRMYTAPVSSHPKSESELLKYVEFQTKASAHKVKLWKPCGDRESSKKEIKIVQSGDRIKRTTTGKPQMKTAVGERCGHGSTQITTQNQEVRRNRITKGSVMKTVTSESSGIRASEAGPNNTNIRYRSRDHYKQRQML